jgi:hypothetical protein
MAKIRNPIRFSEHFRISEESLDNLGVLNPTLNVDTKLFIDPLLIPHSKHEEIQIVGRNAYVEHFNQVIRLLKVSKHEGDVAWRNARRLMEFPEIKWTCLGYGANSISGSGSGAFTTAAVMATTKEIVDLGVEDPDLFVALGLFEDKIGPDRISDMTASVILPGLLAFNKRVLCELGVATETFNLILRSGATYRAQLPVNPLERRRQPILLVPADILRDLPIAHDWSEIADVASKNAALRYQVNRDIGNIWRLRTIKSKSDLRQRVLANRPAFETFIEMLRQVEAKSYDLNHDPLGEVAWRYIAETVAVDQPFALAKPSTLDVDGVSTVVMQIIEQFRFLIEERRYSEELYHCGKPKPEKAAQRLFFAIAYAYCKANNLDITPEADTGNGPVDFKVSSGFIGRVLVEIKLSTNTKVVSGYTRQLETYKGAEETTRGFYVVIDVGKMGWKRKELHAAKNQAISEGQSASLIVFVDGSRRLSASKLS